MKTRRVLIITFVSMFVLVFIILPIAANPTNQKNPTDAALLVQNALNSTTLRSDDSQHPAQVGAGSEPASGADSAFSIEKLVIGLGLFLVIILAIFKWGTSTHHKKQPQ